MQHFFSTFFEKSPLSITVNGQTLLRTSKAYPSGSTPQRVWSYTHFSLRVVRKTIFLCLGTVLEIIKFKCYCSKAIIQQTSHKNIFFQKKQHNHIKLPCNISAFNSRFLENIVIPSKLDANRIIKFWMNSFIEIFMLDVHRR